MHPCDARQVPAQLRHGEPVTEGQRKRRSRRGSCRRLGGFGTPITTGSYPSPPSERQGRCKAFVSYRVRQALPGAKIVVWQVMKGV